MEWRYTTYIPEPILTSTFKCNDIITTKYGKYQYYECVAFKRQSLRPYICEIYPVQKVWLPQLLSDFKRYNETRFLQTNIEECVVTRNFLYVFKEDKPYIQIFLKISLNIINFCKKYGYTYFVTEDIPNFWQYIKPKVIELHNPLENLSKYLSEKQKQLVLSDKSITEIINTIE